MRGNKLNIADGRTLKKRKNASTPPGMTRRGLAVLKKLQELEEQNRNK